MHGGDFSSEIGLLDFDALAQGVAGEAANFDVFTDLARSLLDQFRNGDRAVLDEGLLHQSQFLEALVDATFNDLLLHLLWLALEVIATHFDGFLPLADVRRDLVGCDVFDAGARVGVLIEVNCETDFVARGDMFQELLRDVAMQVAACPGVEYVTTEEIPAEIREREKAIEMGRDDLDGKPEQMKEKIVEGRINKRLKELALMEQPFIKDSSISVADLVKQTAGKIGENVKVRRFTRYTLGEGIEVEETDFAAEVASMQAG